jgi:phosphatidylglycerol:prolipoprotein diacylglycerol transferase
MRPVLFEIGPVAIRSYGVAMAVALIVGVFVATRLGKRLGIRTEDTFDYALILVITSVVMARVVFVLLNLGEFRGGGGHALRVWEGGLSFHGGVIGGLLATLLVSFWKKIPFLRLCDVAAPGAALGYAITRVGCFVNGCCYGVPTHTFLGVRFHDPLIPGGLTPPSHPTQLYSSAAGLVIFFLLLRVFSRHTKDGQVLFWYFVLYGVARFLIEFLRRGVTARIWILGLTEAQWASIVMLIVGIACLMVLARGGSQEESEGVKGSQ